jgi:hypothetical protein
VRACCLLALLVCAPAAAQGRDIYVDNLGGDDTFDGRVPASTAGGGPVRSIYKALRLAAAGDRIVLANTGVPYREQVSLTGGRHSGDGLRPFVLAGNGATLDGSHAIRPAEWEHVAADVFRYRPPLVSFQQLFIDDRPVAREPDAADGTCLARLEPREWCLHEGHIYFCTEPHKTVHHYNLSCAGQRVGLTLFQVHDVLVTDLVVQGFQLDGVNAHDLGRNVLVAGLVSRGNGRSGLAVGGTSRVALVESILGDNGFCQLHASGEAEIRLQDCDLLPASAPPILDFGRSQVIVLPATQRAE